METTTNNASGPRPAGAVIADETVLRARVENEGAGALVGAEFRRFFPVTLEASELERSIDQEKRTVEIAFSSETPVERWFGFEVIDHSPGGIDLSRLRDGAPVLVNHDPDNHVGVVEDARVDQDRKGRARIRFGSSEKAREIFQDVADGIRRGISFGYAITDAEEAGERDGIPVYRVRVAPFEISLASIPADIAVGVGRSRPSKAHNSQEAQTMTEQTATPAPEAPTPVDVSAVENRARDAERTRTAEIFGICRQYNRQDLADEYIKGGKSPDALRRKILEDFGAREVADGSNEVGLTEREARSFSFLRAARYLANPGDRRAREEAAFEIEVSEAAQAKYHREAQGILIPDDVLKTPARRDLQIGSGGTGGNLVATDLLAGSFIEMLRNRMVLERAGVFTLSGLVGNIAIPRQTGGATSYWLGEGGAPVESEAAFDQVPMTPHTVGAFTDISRRLLIQSTPDAETLVRRDLVATLARALDRAGIAGNPATDANQPRGIIYTSGIGSVEGGTNGLAPNRDHLIDLETAVAVDNADLGALAYIFNAKVKGVLSKTAIDAGSGRFVIGEGAKEVNGYPFFASNQVPDDLTKGTADGVCSAIVFGNFQDAMFGLWSGLDMIVDPYSNSTTGALRLVVFQDADFAVRHAESFSAMLDALTA